MTKWKQNQIKAQKERAFKQIIGTLATILLLTTILGLVGLVGTIDRNNEQIIKEYQSNLINN